MASQETTPKVKACWTPEFHKLFVSLCLDQLTAGNKPGTYLNKKGWKYVMDEFYSRTGIMYDKKQFKNHWDSTKEQWKVWNKLKSSAGGEAWDKTTQMIRQNDEWWNDYLQGHPEAAQFRYRGLPLADLLDTVFLDNLASPTAALTPSQNTLSNCDAVPSQATNDMENDDAENALGLIPEPQTENKESPNISQADFDAPVHRKRKKQNTERSIRGLRRESTSMTVGRPFSHLCDAVESGSTVTSTLKERYSIKECVDVLNEMREIPQGSELYMFALDLFVKREYRELFIVLGTAHLRQIWLKRQQRQFVLD
uniref:Zinc finger CCCH domain-containing protein 43 n=1 Tax=Anthurium amnicola TaxID=1678845 RepID=A0A1D1Y5X1_9ARAE